ncbi:G/U mismatch-specific DNA glycosylase [Undibacterium sp.]|uniref:G/U mismatch-specific DNA glycosylase n=1 Tax=Undibacterium sp. TaxID=1914977 RepID=UPI002D7E1CC8|nr:G/U mismatch-specific DNA glycosylase [Undibacterium sp.]
MTFDEFFMFPTDTQLSLPDLLGPGLDVVFCGINPGVCAAERGHHFLGRGNRFWRVLHLAGYTPEQIAPEDDSDLLQYRCGLTTAVGRATASASELAINEFATARHLLTEKIVRWAPRYIAFLGKVAYAAMSRKSVVDWGPQSELFGGASVWVLPNPSGLNRSFSVDDLVCAYRELRQAVDGGDVTLAGRSPGIWQSDIYTRHVEPLPGKYQFDTDKKTKPS